MTTPLIEAIERGAKEEEVKAILSTGVNVNEKGRYGITALMVAAKYSGWYKNLEDVVRLLIDAGANINARTRRNQTALSMAAQFSRTVSSENMVKILLEAGASPNTKRNNLLSAVANEITPKGTSTINTFQMLLDYGADVNAMNTGGQSASLRIVESFLSKRSSPKEMISKKVVDLVLDYSADLNFGNQAKIFLYRILPRFYPRFYFSSFHWFLKKILHAGVDINSQKEVIKLRHDPVFIRIVLEADCVNPIKGIDWGSEKNGLMEINVTIVVTILIESI